MAFGLSTFRVAAAVLALTTAAACSSKKDDPTPTPTPTTGMSWTVDGANVTALSASATTLGTSVFVAGLAGNSTDNTSISLTVPKATGTYAITATSTNADASYDVTTGTTNSSSYNANAGSIVVTTYTASNTAGASVIAGTYTFTGKLSGGTTTKNITNGVFNVKF